MNNWKFLDEYEKFLFKCVIDEGEFNKRYFSKREFKLNEIEHEGKLYRKSNQRAGFDILQHEDIILSPKQISKIKTNVRFPKGIGNNFALVTLRSSYQNSGLIMPAIGILDSDYTDYLFITIFNWTRIPIAINKGNRFAQLIFIKNNDIETKNETLLNAL